MLRYPKILIVLAACIACFGGTPSVAAAKRTVCTITVNSADERDAFRSALPDAQYEFVELVERGRADWLESACRQGVQCDMLVVSGHFNGNDFFSDQLTVNEYLPVEEMERASCSNSCPGLFAHLKEVYLFGCTTLSPDVIQGTGGEVARSLVRAGHPPWEAARRADSLKDRYGSSNRDVMRRVFRDVPAIYGFSAVAPLGMTAGPILQRYFHQGIHADVGSGRTNRRLVNAFAAHGMTVTHGVQRGDPEAAYRAEVCRFVDERADLAAKLRFAHEILGRDMAEVRFFLERIERLVGALSQEARRGPAVRAALASIAADAPARNAFLTFARDSDRADTRARMVQVAHALGWLGDAEEREEMAALVHALLSVPTIAIADIGLACQLATGYALQVDGAFRSGRGADHAAVRACLGDPDAHAAVLAALVSGQPGDAAAAAMYLQQRAFTTDELRVAVSRIGALRDPAAQARAFDVLARHPVRDPAILAALVDLYPLVNGAHAQRAIAGILVRNDYRTLDAPQVVELLRAHRLPSREGGDMVDILIRRLEGASLDDRAADPRAAPG
ncbi:MAG: hypothetical protein ABI920_19470 [Casimicrobiaceae bacterium]